MMPKLHDTLQCTLAATACQANALTMAPQALREELQHLYYAQSSIVPRSAHRHLLSVKSPR